MRIVFILIIAYFVLINLICFALFGIDKYKSKHDKRRIPERVLLWTAFFGGCLGALLGMWTFRHKTQHARFRILVPVMLVLQIALVIAGFWYFFVLPK